MATLRSVPALALLVVSVQLDAACGQGFGISVPGTVKDESSGLTWAQCLLGQSGRDCGGNPLALTWVDSLNEARGSELGSISDWRMPRITEIEMLYSANSNCLPESFPGLGATLVWSASANIDYATDAWAFDFGLGKRVVKARDSELQLWLVSGPN